MSPSPRCWRFREFVWSPGRLPRLMGIVNVTPDSFSDGGALDSVGAAVAHGRRLVETGADLLDIGGESTRPGAAVVPVDEEIERVVPVIRELAERVAVPISIDTSKAAVAEAGLLAGAAVVNDVTGLSGDPDMLAVCRAHEAGIVCMHMQGNPRTMQDDPRYDDVVREVGDYLRRRLEAIDRAGVPRERVILDPGIGFGKTAGHNLELLRAISVFQEIDRPVLIGHSRKGFLRSLLGRPVEERTAGTIGVSIALGSLGVDYLRVHDVSAVRDALLAWETVVEEVGMKGLTRIQEC